jgi:hypothetical protein
MKFTIQKKPLTQMLRALTQQTGRKRSERDSHLRLAAQGSQVIMRANDTETGYEATVFEEGVCFFRYDKFLPLVRSYAGVKNLTIEVTAEGIQIGNTKISRGFWEISLFDNPETAPQTLPKPPVVEPPPLRREDELPFDR